MQKDNHNENCVVLEEAANNTSEDEREVNFCNDDYFQKIFKHVGITLYKELSHPEVALLILLQDFLCYGDCALRMGGRRNGNYLSIEDISKISGFSMDRVRKIIYSLRDKEVMGIHDREDSKQKKWYSINPFIICKGNKVKKKMIDYYSNSKWARKDNENESSEVDINNELRGMINKWKKDSMNFCDYKCVVTGEKFNDLHHLYPFRNIIIETFATLKLEIKQSINDYTSTEKEMIRSELLRLHDLYGYGACLNGKVHALFHSVYGIKDFCYSDFVNFLQDINDGKYNQWFKDSKLNVDMNMNFLRYVKTVGLLIENKNNIA